MSATVTMPLKEYDEMRDEIKALRKAANDNSIVIASYCGYPYHILNADEKMKELVDKINKQGGIK